MTVQPSQLAASVFGAALLMFTASGCGATTATQEAPGADPTSAEGR